MSDYVLRRCSAVLFCSINVLSNAGRSHFARTKFRGAKICKVLVYIGACVACLIYTSPNLAQISITPSEKERDFVEMFIAKGKNPIDIRAAAIQDKKLVSAIKKGSQTRQIRVLLDKESPEISAIVGQKNVQVRIAGKNSRGQFGEKKLSKSFILERGKGFYQSWYGPLVWTKRAFGAETRLYTESGVGPGETAPKEVKIYDQDFLAAQAVKR
jgi:hypothetical protein